LAAVSDAVDVDELRTWLEDGYASSVRTAYLILGNRPDAEDAVQESFLRAWKFRDSLVTGSSFKPWLYRVVVNTCNSKLRKEIPHRLRRRSEDDLDDVATIDDPMGRVALSNDVMSALKDLPAHLRVVVVLRYYADLSEHDIALVIGRQPGTVKSRLNEARSRLALHPALQSEAPSSITARKERQS
jgi:RNA polymerase sigma-70 factor (ECF subfamily)